MDDGMSVQKEIILNLSAYLDFLINSSDILGKDCLEDNYRLIILYDLLNTLNLLAKMDMDEDKHENNHTDTVT